MITDFKVEGLKALWDNRHTENHIETRHRKHHRPHFMISKAHSTQLALCSTDLEGPNSMDTHQPGLEDQGGSGQPNNGIHSPSADPNVLQPTVSSLSMVPPSPTSPPPPTTSLLTDPLPSTSQSPPTTQISKPTPHPSRHLMRSVQRLQTALHKCCNIEIMEEERIDGSTVMHCLRLGCETVWVS